MNQADIGVYGLGTMGSALALNLADKGFRIAISNREADWIAPFLEEAGTLADRFLAHSELEAFVQSLAVPRCILFMIPSGPPMDEMLARLRPLLSEGDTVVDGGNADFNDTRRRVAELSGTGLNYVGMGVSGGEEGARFGPSMMVGGSVQSWDRLRPLLEPIAATYEGDPCVAHMGPDGAGHFVKSLHNGIEYADMQMMAEIYGLLRDGPGWSAGQIGDLFARWNEGPLRSFLVEITAQLLRTQDAGSNRPLVDVIEDKAGQKGTGRWTVIEALKLGKSASAIEAAVGARSWSAEKPTRLLAQDLLPAAAGEFAVSEVDLEQALYAGRLLAHAQGFDVLHAASEEFGWALELSRIAQIWRAGCIIRSDLLNHLSKALAQMPPGGQLLLAPDIAELLAPSLPALRRVVAQAALAGLPVPSLSAALAWYDTMRHRRGTANLIQGQRDLFGAHGFARIDSDGKHHGPWHQG